MTNTRAEALMAAYLSGNITAAERAELLAWVNATPAGKKFFDNAVTLWGMTEQMAYPDFSTRKAAAWTRFEQRLPEVSAVAVPQAAKVRRIGTRTWWAAAAAVALLLIAGWWWLQPAAAAPVFATTETEEKREVTLPDGTQAWLNENTTLRYTAEAGERRVELSGEAYFDVATDSLQPFKIYTEHSVTTVLGTAFNVRAYPDDPRVEVSVWEGKVALALKPAPSPDAVASPTEGNAAPAVELTPGDRGVVEKTTASVSKEVEKAKNSTAWKDGRLDFDQVPLGEVVNVMERYYDVNIELADPALARCLLAGTYTDPPLEELLKVIEYSTELHLEKINGVYRFSGEACE